MGPHFILLFLYLKLHDKHVIFSGRDFRVGWGSVHREAQYD